MINMSKNVIIIAAPEGISVHDEMYNPNIDPTKDIIIEVGNCCLKFPNISPDIACGIVKYDITSIIPANFIHNTIVRDINIVIPVSIMLILEFCVMAYSLSNAI